jgi:hypothetical protein
MGEALIIILSKIFELYTHITGQQTLKKTGFANKPIQNPEASFWSHL